MNYFILTLIYFSLYNIIKKRGSDMSNRKLAIASGEGLARLKWEYEQERMPCEDLLCFGTADMDYRSPEPILSALRDIIDRGHLGYPMVTDRYYDAIHDWLLRTASWDIDARSSVAQNSGIYMEAWNILQILTKPGDKVTILTPVHFCFREIINLNGRKAIECPLVIKGDTYEIDFDSLKACLASGTKVLWLCNPHNPVGRAWTKEELQKIADLCMDCRVYILSDDVYCGLMFPGKTYTPIASLSKEVSYRTVTLYSASKAYNTAGLRHAFLVAENPEIYKRYREALTAMNLDYGQNIMGIAAVTAALSECDSWLSNLMKEIAENHGFIAEFFKTYIPECKVMKAEAAYFAWIDMNALKLRPQTISYLIEQEAHMVVESGYTLGKGGAGFIRFNLAASREHLQEGARRLRIFCEKHKS